MKHQLTDVQIARFEEVEDARSLVDKLFDEKRGEKKGLLVKLVLSTSGQKINGRIYTPKGHKDGIETWTQPYKKPILTFHNREKLPLGRIQKVEWVPEPKAREFFNTDQDYANFLDILDNGSPKEIQKEMNRKGLLRDKAWPGVGHLIADVRFSNKEAVEQVLDERILTFSQSSATDMYACGACGADRKQGKSCSHKMNIKDKSGSINVMICGTIEGSEVSVVNDPGNDLSFIKEIVFEDNAEGTEIETLLSDLDESWHTATYTNELGDSEMYAKISEEDLQKIVQEVAKLMVAPKASKQTEDASDADEVAVAAPKATTTVEAFDTKKLVSLFDMKFRVTTDKVEDSKFLVKSTKQESLSVEVYSLEDIAAFKEMIELVDSSVMEEIQDSLDEGTSFYTKKSEALSDKVEIDNLKKKLEDLKTDYAEALKKIESFEDAAKKVQIDAEVLDANKDSNQNASDKVENPSVSGTGISVNDKTEREALSDTQIYYVDKYSKQLKEKGQEAADMYLTSLKASKYVDRNFDPKKYLKSKE